MAEFLDLFVVQAIACVWTLLLCTIAFYYRYAIHTATRTTPRPSTSRLNALQWGRHYCRLVAAAETSGNQTDGYRYTVHCTVWRVCVWLYKIQVMHKMVLAYTYYVAKPGSRSRVTAAARKPFVIRYDRHIAFIRRINHVVPCIDTGFLPGSDQSLRSRSKPGWHTTGSLIRDWLGTSFLSQSSFQASSIDQSGWNTMDHIGLLNGSRASGWAITSSNTGTAIKLNKLPL